MVGCDITIYKELMDINWVANVQSSYLINIHERNLHLGTVYKLMICADVLDSHGFFRPFVVLTLRLGFIQFCGSDISKSTFLFVFIIIKIQQNLVFKSVNLQGVKTQVSTI